MSKRSFRIALGVVLVTVLAAGGGAAYVVKRALGYPDQRRAGTGREVVVDIAPGMTFPQIARLLHDKEVVDNPRWFRLYAMHRGVTTKVRSGQYVLRDDMTPDEVLDQLLKGVKAVTVSVTVPEGLHMLEVFDIIEQKGVVKAGALEELARDPDFLEKHGIAGDTVEGYLFPETYRFKVPSKPHEVLDKMIRHFRIVWDRVRRGHERSIRRLEKQLEWSDRDLLTLASIVQKEAADPAEDPTIAQVFINRLSSPRFQPKRLETDPTIRYGCQVPLVKSAACKKWNPGDRLHRAQLNDKDNPYNTYQHEGLPPGPICNPGQAALEAAVDPDGSKYFYFVARDEKHHVFSRTRAEHERAVDKYQR